METEVKIKKAEGKGKNKPYDPALIEEKIYRSWERIKAFQPAKNPKRGQKSFSIVIPPPNVTGSLHMGHALNASMQDALVRYHRMNGDDVVWIPGTDHAGIATQNVVEKQLKKNNITRHDLGREKFIEKVWEWKEQYGKTISEQLRRIGSSCDWSRERFTMDPGYVRAVQEAFIHYANKGLIYRGDRIVNWCPRCASSISDLEVKHEEKEGLIYEIIYPLLDGSGSITVATTRPETMLGDTAVAVYPGDERCSGLVGKKIKLPLVGREIPVVADHVVDKSFGTGAVKVTPAHDQSDWEIGERNKLPIINVIGEDGKMTDATGSDYVGLSFEEAREKVVSELKLQGYIKDEPKRIKHNVSLCDRCGTIIQPLVSKQWFVKMEPLARPAMEAVEKGIIKFEPKRWNKIYLEWLGSVKDWCISRQLWWGHQLPVWYCQADKTNDEKRIMKNENTHIIFSVQKPKKCSHCGGTEFVQDQDVLDTWFSSALWPFAVFGWPEMTDDLARFYPTSVLATGRDIINLWVARMVFSGLEFMDQKKYLPAKNYGKTGISGQVPFRNVIIHPTVLNLKGQRMSKSLGTGIDPMDLIKQYGADATRFGLLIQTQQDQQALRFDENAVRTGRNFANKLWNIARFIQTSDFGNSKKVTLFDLWIKSRLETVKNEVTACLEEFRFGDAIRTLHSFVWDDFADWYIEASKTEGMTSQKVALAVFRETLQMLHPFMPFVSEELWKLFKEDSLLINSAWPKLKKQKTKSGNEIELFINIVKELRSLRNLLGIPVGIKPEISFKASKKIESLFPAIRKMCNFSDVVSANVKGSQWIKMPVKKLSSAFLKLELVKTLPLLERLGSLNKERQVIQEDIIKIEKRLEQMGEKAPVDIVLAQRENLNAKYSERNQLEKGIVEIESLIKNIG